MSSVRRLARHEWRDYRCLRLRALAESPDAFATTLAEAQTREDSAWSRQAASGAEARLEITLVAERDSRLIGVVSSRIDPADPDRACLYQMWVDPEFRRLGTGRALLDAAIRWAVGTDARVLALSVTRGDTAATRLYARAGFEPVGPPEPLRPGSDRMVQPMELHLGAT